MTESPASVLIVEDDEPVRSFLADNLTADGYEVLLAGCIRDAVRQLEYKKPDVVLLDISMPVMDGIEATQRIRESSERACILMLTGSDASVDIDRARSAGAAGYVTKDRIAAELIDAILEIASR